MVDGGNHCLCRRSVAGTAAVGSTLARRITARTTWAASRMSALAYHLGTFARRSTIHRQHHHPARPLAQPRPRELPHPRERPLHPSLPHRHRSPVDSVARVGATNLPGLSHITTVATLACRRMWAHRVQLCSRCGTRPCLVHHPLSQPPPHPFLEATTSCTTH
jgi:hypothetical protein